jgi:hypothetical protein
MKNFVVVGWLCHYNLLHKYCTCSFHHEFSWCMMCLINQYDIIVHVRSVGTEKPV